MEKGLRLDFVWLAIPITFLAGFLLGKKLHGTIGMTASAIVGASAYILSLIILAGPPAVFTFDIFTNLLMVAFGALVAVFGWFIGENYELPIRRKTS